MRDNQTLPPPRGAAFGTGGVGLLGPGAQLSSSPQSESPPSLFSSHPAEPDPPLVVGLALLTLPALLPATLPPPLPPLTPLALRLAGLGAIALPSAHSSSASAPRYKVISKTHMKIISQTFQLSDRQTEANTIGV